MWAVFFSFEHRGSQSSARYPLLDASRSAQSRDGCRSGRWPLKGLGVCGNCCRNDNSCRRQEIPVDAELTETGGASTPATDLHPREKERGGPFHSSQTERPARCANADRGNETVHRREVSEWGRNWRRRRSRPEVRPRLVESVRRLVGRDSRLKTAQRCRSGRGEKTETRGTECSPRNDSDRSETCDLTIVIDCDGRVRFVSGRRGSGRRCDVRWRQEKRPGNASARGTCPCARRTFCMTRSWQWRLPRLFWTRPT